MAHTPTQKWRQAVNIQPTVNPPLPERRRINTGAIITRAAAIIERNGLNQGGFVEAAPADSDVPRNLAYRRVCAAGAIRLATSGNPEEDCPAARAAIRLLSELLPGDAPTDDQTGDVAYVEHVARWNDAEGRTTAEVASVLRQLALRTVLEVAA
jgi:hypothetical protein